MPALVGRNGEVTVAIPKGGVGQVTLAYGGERSEHIARSEDGQAVPRGSLVVVRGFGGDSIVVARAESAKGGLQ